MKQPERSRHAFTIVEILVVVGILGILVAIILPALAGAQRRSTKLGELGNLRQVGIAWTLYAAQNDDRILPGYLGTTVQKNWRLTQHFASGATVPPAPDYYAGSVEEPRNVAGPWPWRLASFLDHAPGALYGHRATADTSPADLERIALEVSNAPAFSYNAFHVGGWWDTERRPRYDGSRRIIPYSVVQDGSINDEEPRFMRLVAQAVGSVRRPAHLLTYTTSAYREPGVHRHDPARDDFDAFHAALPPRLSTYDFWGELLSGPGPTHVLVESYEVANIDHLLPET